MSRSCQYSFADRSGLAEWSFDGDALVVSPADGQPLVLPLKEVAGISGDGYTISLMVPGSTPAIATSAGPAASAAGVAARAAGPAPALALTKLGAEGPTLLDTLQRTWLVARTKALRLGGSGEGESFSGTVTERAAAEPFRALLFEDLMLIAREGRDLDPVFLALIENVTFDDDTYSIRVTEWPGRELVFSKLGRATEDFVDSLKKRREALASEAGAALSTAVPSLPPAQRAVLAGEWPPGRLRTLRELDTIAPGFAQTFRDTWLPACMRKDEGAFLLEWAEAGSCWLGCSREESDSGAPLLWLLAEKSGTWFLEALGGEDRATYQFSGGGELPALVSRLLCAPQFSKEALYGTPEMLTGERADLAIAAQFLEFLVRLRGAFKGRIIHSSPAGWRKEMAAAGGVAPSSG